MSYRQSKLFQHRSSIFKTLAQTVQDSAQSNNEKSYTKYLLTEGIEKITKIR